MGYIYCKWIRFTQKTGAPYPSNDEVMNYGELIVGLFQLDQLFRPLVIEVTAIFGPLSHRNP